MRCLDLESGRWPFVRLAHHLSTTNTWDKLIVFAVRIEFSSFLGYCTLFITIGWVPNSGIPDCQAMASYQPMHYIS